MSMQTVTDLMTPDPLSLQRGATLKDAHELMRIKNIRHIPVIDNEGFLIGMLTQKVLIGAVINLLAKYGAAALDHKEQQLGVATLMLTDFATVTPDQSLTDVAEFFVSNRHGCLPVVSGDNKLLGILTSSDFVKLAVQLLAEKA
ncbi:CBS domain-containing protein [Alishewanella sp. 16-MA]|uniref:CBS domain-containing protein n=1 Tax=Alishewanella maricola TaxID=2795740 RepID=A0ABS8C0E0_9ALTE|nr:CBS domain-containing protein [Alishewanella maricola]MCB5225787.1 CBS domain-containing protein [Alishewanella maricola]